MDDAYIGQRRGATPAPVRISGHEFIIDGIRQYQSPSTGAYWYSADGNTWHATPEAAVRA
jgi:hypothetical protein